MGEVEVVKEHTVIIGAGPCGLSCALELRARGIDPLLLEKENIVHSITQYPLHLSFFSTPELLEIGGIPFTTPHEKPTRDEALAYYLYVIRIPDKEEIPTNDAGNAGNA